MILRFCLWEHLEVWEGGDCLVLLLTPMLWALDVDCQLSIISGILCIDEGFSAVNSVINRQLILGHPVLWHTCNILSINAGGRGIVWLPKLEHVIIGNQFLNQSSRKHTHLNWSWALHSFTIIHHSPQMNFIIDL